MEKDRTYELSKQIAGVCKDHDIHEIIQAMGSFLSYILQDEEPENGIKMLMSMAMAAIETAYDLHTEFLDTSKLQ